MKERREYRISQEVAAASVGELCSKTFAVSRGTLPVPGIGVIRLLDAGSEAGAENGNWIECAPCSERKFLFPSEWGGVINVACIEVWDEADKTLFLFSSYLFSGNQVCGTDCRFYV
ncbi:MAG TPA: hypothetical protein VIW93_02135 [Candidatus Acidoferrum sp.]